MAREDYFTKLYPLQDAVLAAFSVADTEFYLTGGTASSRGYLEHRFSDDLDLFVNDDQRFALWADRLIASVAHHRGSFRTRSSPRCKNHSVRPELRYWPCDRAWCGELAHCRRDVWLWRDLGDDLLDLSLGLVRRPLQERVSIEQASRA